MHNPRVRHIMGTAISIDVRDAQVGPSLVEDAFEWLAEVDHRFSTFDSNSEVSRLGRGELTVDECHPDVAEVLAICQELQEQSRGVFNAWRARPDGRLEPSGAVKGWALERAADMLTRGGARNFCINGGGDVVVRGDAEPGRRWRVGIRHPRQAASVAAVVEVSDCAVATSGTYERGDHIVDARTGQPARGLISLTVIGPTMTRADGFATAGFAMGVDGISWVAAQPGYSAYGVTTAGRVRYSQSFARQMSI